MEKEYKITVEFTDDNGENSRLEIISRGYALIAFDAKTDGHEKADNVVSIMTASVKDIKNAIMRNAYFAQAACLAKGELDAEMYGKRIELAEMGKTFDDFARRMKGLLK